MTSDRITIREASAGDVETVTNFQMTMAEESEGVRLDRAVLRQGVEAVIDDPAKGAYQIAEVGGEPVGCLLTVPEWSDWRNGTVIWIHSVFVAPQARRKGVFRAMYLALRERVEASEDLKGLRLYVDKTNTRAQGAYEALGMDGSHYHLYEWLKE